MPKVGVDPGHGGRDPGAVGPGGLQEKDVNLAVALRLQGRLEQAGVQVVMTRWEDEAVELKERSDYLNRQGVDLVVSVHCNSSSRLAADYLSVFIYALGGEGEKAAKEVLAALVKATGWPDGGVRVKNFHMLRETKAPAILVEQGFISNPAQERQLARPEFQQELAGAIAEGLLRYFGLERKTGVANLPNVLSWAAPSVAKAVAVGLVASPELLNESEQKVLVWLDRLGIL